MIDNTNTKKLLLKGGRIIDPFSKKTFIGDLLVDNGTISKIADSIPSKGKDFNIIEGDDLRDIEASYRAKTKCLYIGKKPINKTLKAKYKNTMIQKL